MYFFMDRLKAAVMELVLALFYNLFILLVLMAKTSLLKFLSLKRIFLNFPNFQPDEKKMFSNSNKYKVSKNKHTTAEDKNKQIHSQVK